MPKNIRLPDGSVVAFPDTMSDDDIGSAIKRNQPTPQQGFASSAADSSGLSTLWNAVTHPLDTAKNIGGVLTYGGGDTDNPIINGIKGTVANTVNHGSEAIKAAKSGNYAGAVSHAVSGIPMVGPVLDKATDQYADKNYSGEMGTLSGLNAAIMVPSIAKTALPAVGRGLEATGAASQDAGVGIMNKTVGTLSKDFKRGANPGQAYLDAGGTPALSMSGLADKGAQLQSSVGRSIPATIAKSGAVVPVSDVVGKLQPPISEAVDLATGPGGMGDTTAIDNYSAQFRPTIKNAIATNGLTAPEVYSLKRSIAKNTNWSDPTQFNLKSVRQQQVGGLGGLLEDNVPGLADLNDQYAGLKNFATRAQTRSETGSMPLTSLARQHMFALGGAGLGTVDSAFSHSPIPALVGAGAGLAADSVPVKSSLGYGLYQGGKGLQSLGSGIGAVPPFNPASVAIPTYSLIRKKDDDANQ